jgi:alkanesulfonate monooxygenase SsuD/methylene tetrahydromethanopterin reductase-like flavin-dependent oxidoreductase (luciferase family)
LPDFVHKDELLRGHCAAVGRDDAEITRSTNLDVVIGHSQGEIDDRLAGIRDRLERGGVPQDKVEARMRHYATSPGCGTPEQLLERLTALGTAGLGYAIANFAEAAYDTSGVEAFEREVIPELA